MSDSMDTPLGTLTSQENSEAYFADGRVHGTAEFWYNITKIQTNLTRLLQSLVDVERAVPSFGGNFTELKDEMLRLGLILQKMTLQTEFSDSTDLSDASSH